MSDAPNDSRERTSDLELLRADAHTSLAITQDGRIERQNDPDRTPGPRLLFAGCAQGNFSYVGHDVPDGTALRLTQIAERQPSWRDADLVPPSLVEFVDVLSGEQRAVEVSYGFSYVLPHDCAFEHEATLVQDDTAEGNRLAAHFGHRGLPQRMVDAGFNTFEDLWRPWCIALDGEEVASIAFAARLGPAGAAVGVHTFPGFRGRGFAAAATAGWSALPSLSFRRLFYGTQRSNRSSQRVTDRLGMRRIGAFLALR